LNEGIEKARKLLDPKIYQAAATSTVNKLMTQAKTTAVNEAVKHWNIKKATLPLLQQARAACKSIGQPGAI